MNANGAVAPAGELGLRLIRRSPDAVHGLGPARELTAREVVRYGLPHRDLTEDVRTWRASNVRHLWRGVRRVMAARALNLPTFYGALYLKVVKADGREIPLGLASLRVVTTVGCGYIVDAFQNSTELENMKYHALGTGSTAEAAADTALVTELTTEYTGNVRATGTTTEASALVYRTVATNTLDGTPGADLREHGVFSASSAGVLLDRTVFGALALVSGDGLESTYDLTFTAGS